jgi:hypothetical protein
MLILVDGRLSTQSGLRFPNKRSFDGGGYDGTVVAFLMRVDLAIARIAANFLPFQKMVKDVRRARLTKPAGCSPAAHGVFIAREGSRAEMCQAFRPGMSKTPRRKSRRMPENCAGARTPSNASHVPGRRRFSLPHPFPLARMISQAA